MLWVRPSQTASGLPLTRCGLQITNEEKLHIKICPHFNLANCDFLQGCGGWRGAKLGREEVGMREFSLQEIEEQLFDKEMSIEEDMLDY